MSTLPRSHKPCAACNVPILPPARYCPACATKHVKAENKRSRKYQTPAWRTQRARIVERDHRQCVVCGSTTRLNVHHLDRDADNPTVPDHRLVTLCHYHHGQLEMNQRYGNPCTVQQRLDQHLADSPHHGDDVGEWNPFG